MPGDLAPPQGGGGILTASSYDWADVGVPLPPSLHSRPVPETTNPESYRFAKFGDLGSVPSPFAITQGLLLTSSRMAKSRKKPGGLRPILEERWAFERLGKGLGMLPRSPNLANR